MSSADFSLLPLGTCSQLSPIGLLPSAAGDEISRDKVVDFRRVLPDLLYEITVDIWAFPIYGSVALPSKPCIRFLFVRTTTLLMASFRFRVTPDTLANR